MRLTIVTGSFSADHCKPYGEHRHGEPVKWDDFDAEQQTIWDKAAVRFACLIGPASDTAP